jgi:hypothetical protein
VLHADFGVSPTFNISVLRLYMGEEDETIHDNCNWGKCFILINSFNLTKTFCNQSRLIDVNLSISVNLFFLKTHLHSTTLTPLGGSTKSHTRFFLMDSI